ncbi:MAG: cell wall-active antibiotics response protein [Ferruginibacter sp.]|nr:cell wall-active antibiotics response protein [Ferruginibacter sp.]
MENTKNYRDRESGRVVGGLILVAVGAALLLRNLDFFMPAWLFTWPMILILVGIYTGFRHSFRNNSWFIMIAVGSFFLVSRFIPSLSLQPLFWPIVIIGLGVAFILRPPRNNWGNTKTGGDYTKWKTTPAESVQDPVNIASLDSSDYLLVRSVFSGVNRNIVSKNFQGGQITSVFGGAEIDLSQADITGQVIIKLEIAFGGVKLVVPPHWTVQNEIDGIFHGVDDKRNFNPSATIKPDKVLILKGSAVFGGIEIRSY